MMKHTILRLFSKVAMIAVAGVLSMAMAWGQTPSTSTLNFTAKCNGSGTANDGAKWTVTSDGTESNFDSTSGIHYGTNNAAVTYVQLSTSDISGIVSQVVVNARDAQEIATISVTVGGSAFTCSGSSKSTNTSSNYTFTGSGSGAIVVRVDRGSSLKKAIYVKSVAVTYISSSSPICATPSFSPVAGTYTSAQNVTISTSTQDATIYYTTNGSTPTKSSSVYSSAINVSSTTTIKAIAVKTDYDDSAVASATYTILPAGTQADPYTVSDARVAIDAGVGKTNVHVSGIVCTGGSNLNSGALTYWISDDGTETDKLQIYKGKGLSGANFSSTDDIKVGDEVMVYGSLIKYNSTYEFSEGSQLVTFNRPVTPSIDVDKNSVNAPAAGADGTINVTYNNITSVAADVAFYAQDGTTPATYDWVDADINGSNNLEYLVEENTSSEARSAYLKVWAYDDELNEVYSELITITQAGYVADYATLPFAFDGGKNTIASTAGLTESGLGSDYTSKPYLKFDNTGDELVLKINEAPGVLSFDIKGNSFSGGTFKVQASADGTNYTDVASYTSLGDTENKEITTLTPSVRYIKWVYTNKSSGNVALGNIALAKPSTDPAIILDSYSVDAPAAGDDGTINVTYKNITSVVAEVFFCASDGTTPATYNWIDAEINNENNVEYLIDANTGDARTAYFKVHALDDESHDVYSDLVTITQAEYVPPVVADNWVKTALADLTSNDVFVIVGDDGDDVYAMSNDSGSSSSPSAVAVTADLSINDWSAVVDDNLQWNISGNASEGFVFYPNGSTDTWLYCINDNKGVRVGDGAAKHFKQEDGYLTTKETNAQRFIGVYNSLDWRCYTSTSGNIAGQSFAFYKKIIDAPATVNLTATQDNGRYWVTFYTGAANYALPEGAQAFTMNSDKELYRVGADGSVIPAGKAVIIIADAANLTLNVRGAKADVTIHGNENILKGSDTATAVAGITGTPYVLGIVNGVLGFYKFTGSEIPAGKAYYVVND